MSKLFLSCSQPRSLAVEKKNHKLPFYSRSSFVLQPHIFPPLVRESTDRSMQMEHACIVHRPLSQQCVTSVTLCAWVGKTTLVRSKGAAAVKRCLQQFKMRNDKQAYRKGAERIDRWMLEQAHTRERFIWKHAGVCWSLWLEQFSRDCVTQRCKKKERCSIREDDARRRSNVI